MHNSFIAFLCSIFIFSCYGSDGMDVEGTSSESTNKRKLSTLELPPAPITKRQKLDTLAATPDEIWLPDEIWPTIFKYAKPMGPLRGVCREWCRIISSFLTTISAPPQATDSDLLSINEGFLSPDTLRLRENDIITHNAVMQLTNLTNLYLKIGSKGFQIQFLQNLPSLTRLRLETFYNTPMNYTFQPLTKLKDLIWEDNGNNITDKTMGELTQLKTLRLKGARRISDDVFQRLTNLTALGLWESTEITNNALEKLTNLTELGLSGNRTITIDPLYKLPKLTALNLSRNSRFTLDELRRLSNLTSLNGDDLNADTLILDEDFNDAALLQFTKLTSLDLGENLTITPSAIQQLTNLTSLDLRNWLFAVNRLRGHHLEKLREDSITADTLSHLPNLTILNGSYLNIDTLILDSWYNNDILLQFTNLTSLDLTDNHQISGTVIQKLTNLTSLLLPQYNSYPNPNVTINDFFCLPNLKILNGYNLDMDRLVLDKRFNDAALPLFTNLTSLDLKDNDNISGTVIQGLTNLTSLSLPKYNFNHKTRITGNDFCCLPNLKILNGYDLNVDALVLDKGFDDAALLLFTNLTNLDFKREIFSEFYSEFYNGREETFMCWERPRIKAQTIWQLPNLTSLNHIKLTTETICADDFPDDLLNDDQTSANGFSLLYMFTNMKQLHLGRNFNDLNLLQKLTNVISVCLGRYGVEYGERQDDITLLTNITYLDLEESEEIWAADVFSLPNLTALSTKGKTFYLSSPPALPMELPFVDPQLLYQGVMIPASLMPQSLYPGQQMIPEAPQLPSSFYQYQGVMPEFPLMQQFLNIGQTVMPEFPGMPQPLYHGQGMMPGSPPMYHPPYQPQAPQFLHEQTGIPGLVPQPAYPEQQTMPGAPLTPQLPYHGQGMMPASPPMYHPPYQPQSPQFLHEQTGIPGLVPQPAYPEQQTMPGAPLTPQPPYHGQGIMPGSPLMYPSYSFQ